ncbi:hypothetical protein OG203_03425 [Nocardia sp. NBC_01499]|uniref:hypothetical protein n=1 Tax=Nocardia sp. NBC_01499 TaxID=2903597 RepID=UPI00386960E1
MNTHITGSRPRSLRPRLSIPLLAIATTSLAAGIVSGGLAYLNRSPDHEAHVAGTTAWWPHLVLLALTAIITTAIVRQRGPHATRLLLLAPLGTTAANRLTHTIGSILNRPSALPRLLLAIPPTALLIYSPFRAGMQILGGLDPNFTANAWGGPTYLGAMACHYLDGALLTAAAAALLNLLLLPAEHGKQATG